MIEGYLMGRILLKIIFTLLLIGSCAIAGYLGYSYKQLKNEHQALDDEYRKLERRAELIHKRYEEERARVSALTRSKLVLEGEMRQAREQAASLTEQIENLKIQIANVKKEKKNAEGQLEKKYNDLVAEKSNLEKSLEDAKNKLSELKNTINEKDTTIKDLELNLAEVHSDLEMQTSKFERCLSNNSDLCDIASDLMEKYKNKGIGSALLQKEPFTQVEKIKIEQLMQEYSEKIEKEKVRDSQ